MSLHCGILHSQAGYVKSVVHLEVFHRFRFVDGIKCGLCVAQCQVEGAGLQHVARVFWRESQRHAAIHYIFAKSHSYLAHSVLGAFFVHGIIVKRAPYARKRWIEIAVVGASHHFLYYHCHLLLVDNVARGLHICLAVGEEHRGIHSLYGVAQLLEHGSLIGEMRYHVGGIDAGKGLIMAIFEQTRRTYGKRPVYHIEEGIEVVGQSARQCGCKKMLQYLLIAARRQGYGIELVFLHELVENVGTQHHRAGYLHAHTFEIVEFGIFLYYAVDKRQAASLAAERPLPYAGKIAVMVEAVALEYCHHAAVLHAAIFHYGIKHGLAHCLLLGDVVEGVLGEHFGYREQRTRIEPSRYIVVIGMIIQRLGGYVENAVLKSSQVLDAAYHFAGLGIAYDKVAESEVIEYGLP